TVYLTIVEVADVSTAAQPLYWQFLSDSLFDYSNMRFLWCHTDQNFITHCAWNDLITRNRAAWRVLWQKNCL
ncbi:hypothetical protein, partial [Nitrosomonas nitrosa]|uniref:hypothetical protein n=1 Tax=Nitrosomonas nitrosa TaxID=52442 RepID=UPI0023F88ED3